MYGRKGNFLLYVKAYFSLISLMDFNSRKKCNMGDCQNFSLLVISPRYLLYYFMLYDKFDYCLLMFIFCHKNETKKS